MKYQVTKEFTDFDGSIRTPRDTVDVEPWRVEKLKANGFIGEAFTEKAISIPTSTAVVTPTETATVKPNEKPVSKKKTAK